jgi:hypothetical protein
MSDPEAGDDRPSVRDSLQSSMLPLMTPTRHGTGDSPGGGRAWSPWRRSQVRRPSRKSTGRALTPGDDQEEPHRHESTYKTLAAKLAPRRWRFDRATSSDELLGRAEDFQRYLDKMPNRQASGTSSMVLQGAASASGSAPRRSLSLPSESSGRGSAGRTSLLDNVVNSATLRSVEGDQGDPPDSSLLAGTTMATPEDPFIEEPEVQALPHRSAWTCWSSHDEDVRRWLDEMPLGYEETVPVPRDIWRGLPISRMLGQGPGLMSNSQTESTFLLSEQLEDQQHIDIFLSHTWSSNAWLKYAAMLYYFNGRNSIVAAHSAALAAFLMLLAVKELTSYGGYLPVFYVPMPGNVEEYPKGLPVCGPCFFIGCVVQIGTYVFGHFIWFWTRGVYRKTVFLDKCCIHQTDEDMKRRGVEHVGSFVKQSRSMFIPFDDDYFERLWCAYELAAFVRYKKSDVIHSLNFMPIKVAVFVFCIAVFGFIGTTGFMFMVAVNDLLFFFWPPQNWLWFFGMWGIGGTLVFGVPKFIFCHLSLQSRKTLDDKLANFTVHNAKVTMEDDRHMIEHCIREWFGSTQVFDQIVQRLFPEIVNRALGTEQQALRFADVLQENAGVLFLFIYDAVLVAYPHTERVARALAIGFSAHFVIDPLYLYSLNMLARACLRLRFGTWTNHSIRGFAVFIVGLGYPAWFAFCIGSPLWRIAAVSLGLGALVPFIFRM